MSEKTAGKDSEFPEVDFQSKGNLQLEENLLSKESLQPEESFQSQSERNLQHQSEKSFQSEENLQLVIFELSGEEFGVDIMQVSEIIPAQKITRIPQAPECVKGIVNLRGNIIVVIDLNKRLGFSSKETDSLSKIIIAEFRDTITGIPVNSVSEIMTLPLPSIEPVPEMIKSKINAEYLAGVGKAGDRLIILLNLARVLGEEVDEPGETIFSEENL